MTTIPEVEEKRDCAKCCVPLNKVKMGVRIYATFTGILLVVVLGGNYLFNDADASNGNRIAITKNTQDIDHTEKDVDEMKEDHRVFVQDMKEISQTQGRMDRNLATLMGAMGVKAEIEN